MGGNKLNYVIIAITALLSMAVAFIIIYLVISGTPSTKSHQSSTDTKEAAQNNKKEKVDNKNALTISISEIDPINLKSSNTSTKSIVKLRVSLLIADKKFEEEIKKREAEIQDIIVSTFWNKTGDELENGKAEKVKEEILTKIRAIYPEPKEANKIVKVLFDSFFLQ